MELNEVSLIDEPALDEFSDEDEEDCESCWTIVGSEPEFVKYIEYIPQPQPCETSVALSIPFVFLWRQLIVLLIVVLIELSNSYAHYHTNPVVVVISTPGGSQNLSANYSMPILKLTLPDDALNWTAGDNYSSAVMAISSVPCVYGANVYSVIVRAIEGIQSLQSSAMTFRIDCTALVQTREQATAAVDKVVDAAVDTVANVLVGSVLYVLEALDLPERGVRDAETVGTCNVVCRVVLTVMLIMLGVHLHNKYA